MAFLPTIPSSFVPHETSPARTSHADFAGAFSLFSYLVLAVVFVSAVGVFSYGRILTATQTSREAALIKATATIDADTIEDFVRLQDRLNSSQALLKSHVAFSNFFSSLQTLLPASVRFTALHISTSASGVTKVEGSGVAKSFNALTAASMAFTTESHIKDVIFSKISITRENTISFGFSATLDPRLTAFSATAFENSPPTSP